MPMQIVRQDIARMAVDAIVCNGNRDMEKRDGVCGSVFSAAGPELERHCAALGGCDTGAAVVTPGFALPAKYIIHTVGPHYIDGSHGEENILRCCYRNVFAAAEKLKVRSLATPLIASGRYRYPKEEALRIANEEIGAFLADNEDVTVWLVVFSPEATLLSHSLQESIREYITAAQYETYRDGRRQRPGYSGLNFAAESLAAVLNHQSVGFRETLLAFVERSGKNWVEIYKKAQVERAVASRIMTRPSYHPSRGTALALAIALELTVEQTNRLLASFGAVLSPASRTDLIVMYFLSRRDYDIFKVNEALFDNGESCLTGSG